MSLKYNLQRGHVYVSKDGSDEAIVEFEIFDDEGVGRLAERLNDSVNFPLDPGDWPLSKANLKSKAEAAIVDKYPGAVQE